MNEPTTDEVKDDRIYNDDGTLDTEAQIVVRKEILDRIDDSLDLESDWRIAGQKIQDIYHGRLAANGMPTKNSSRFNSLNTNTSILLPSLYSRPPKPEISCKSASALPMETLASDALQKTVQSFLEDDTHSRAIKAAVKEVLLPGRGTVRLRWDPIVETKQATNEMGEPVQGADGNPIEVMEKLLDQVSIEHVYWENYTQESVSSWENCGWVAFKHLFTKKKFMAHFKNSASVRQFQREGKLDDIFKWTDKAASMVRGSSSTSTPSNIKLQDVIKKAMVWEYWDKSTRETVWLCHDMEGHVLQIDPDILELEGFFPCPEPLLAITTTDSMIPTPEYTIYQDLATEVDLLSDRIDAMTRRVKVRGAYNAASESLGNVLAEEDGMMVAINGLDIDNDISKHLYIIPITEVITALNVLYQSRNESKQAMYEVTGISDIIRGQTRASETLGAQRIKSQFATLRIEDRKVMIELFVKQIINMLTELICEHFSAESIYYYSDVQLPEEAYTSLRTDGRRKSKIDIETDSTISVDETADQNAMSGMLTSLGTIFQQVLPLVREGLMPLPIAMEIIKLATKPFKYSKNLAILLDKYMLQLEQATQQQQPAPGQMQPGNPMPAGPQAVPNQGMAG